ncbi:methyltransferase domain-containing protein [Peziza echinospora]|nr:methyltransferase domain-containing protein [Peziza echinospora]
MLSPPPNQPPLPHSAHFGSTSAYVRSLLEFSQNPLLQTLCGGVHMLDFFTRPPPHDLYSTVIPALWREYLDGLDIHDVLHLLMRSDPDAIEDTHPGCPDSLKDYIIAVRRHTLARDFIPRKKGENFSVDEDRRRRLMVGMSPKKMHEVENISRFLHHLLSPSENAPTSSPPTSSPSTSTAAAPITHIVDFGSGQGYLPRLISNHPFAYNVVGLERNPGNISGAKNIDEKVAIREAQALKKLPPAPPLPHGSVLYVEKSIDSGDLTDVVSQIRANQPEYVDKPVGMLVTSLHSCGNLANHGITSLLTTPEVSAVAIIGCCYNLLTENAGRTTHEQQSLNHKARILAKSAGMPDPETLPPLRSIHPRLRPTPPSSCPSCPQTTTTPTFHPPPEAESSQSGFPLSNTFSNPPELLALTNKQIIPPITLNITARMMACQAPQNWTPTTSSSFFKRHFYRALLQKLFLDAKLINYTPDEIIETINLGSLKPPAVYDSFQKYATAAAAKLGWTLPQGFCEEGVLEGWEERFSEGGGEHRLRILWSLMAFSAGVVEALVVVDRWCWLAERRRGGCWVEAVFEYEYSPRNLVVVGVKAPAPAPAPGN